MKKKLLLVLILAILLVVPSINAYEFDNWKTTKEIIGSKYPEVTIENFFGLGNDLWKGTLIKNTEYCQEDCSAEKRIILYKEGSLVDDIMFETILKNNSRITQDIISYKFYVQTGETNETVNDYQFQCGAKETDYKNCANVLVGSHIETTPTWEEYIMGNIVSAGTYNVKLEGKKNPLRTVDWIIKTNGEWIEEWATWTSGDNVTDVLQTDYSNTDSGSGSCYGVRFNITSLTTNTTLLNITKFPGSTAVMARLRNETGEVASSTFVGHNTSFNYILVPGISYDILLGNGASTYTRAWNVTTITSPLVKTNINFITALSQAVCVSGGVSDQGSLHGDNVQSITTKGSDAQVILNSPVNNFESIKGVTFNCSTTGHSIPVVNMSLMIQSGTWNVNQTLTKTGTVNESIFQQNFSIGRFNWSCMASDGDGDNGFPLSNRTIIITATTLNSIFFNTSTYESLSESFKVNLTINEGTIVTGKLWYNGTSYTPTTTNNNLDYIFTYPFSSVPLLKTENVAENRSFFWETTIDSVSQNTSLYYQIVNPINLSLCYDGSRFLNISFADEKTLAKINATIENTWTFGLGGTLTRANTFKNISYSSTEYNFCFEPRDKNMTISGTSKHYNAIYPQRKYNYAKSYNNQTTNITVYLLGSSDGIYTTFQVLAPSEIPMSGVTATVKTTINSQSLQTDAGITGDDGGVTFWVDPDKSHTFTFSKTGYSDVITSLTPTQSQYTIYMGGGAVIANVSTLIDYSRGITYDINPFPGSIIPNTEYTFVFNLSSTYWNLDSWGYTIRASDILVASNSSTIGTGGSLSSTLNSGTNESISMFYFWVINGTYVNSTSWHWYGLNIIDKGYGINRFFSDWGTYMDSGMFGATAFTKYLIIFLIMFGIIGITTYSFRITEPAYLLVIITANIIIFDALLGLFPKQYVLSTLVSLITIMALAERWTR